MKRLIIVCLLLFATQAMAQDLRPSAYVGQQKKVTVRGGKIQGSTGGVTTLATQDITPTVNATTYIYVDLSSTPTVSTSTSGFPASSYFPICQVVTDINGIITSFTDSRPDFFMAGGSSSSSSQGPVINVTNTTYSGCFATVTIGQDWSNCFASVAAASNAAAFVNQGGIAFKNQCSAQVTTGPTTLSCNIAIAAGDTVVVFVSTNHINGQTITVADSSGANPYVTYNVRTASGSAVLTTLVSVPGVSSAASSVTVTDTPAEVLSMAVVTYTGVGAFGTFLLPSTMIATGSSTAPSIAHTTQDNNNFIASGVAFGPAGTPDTLAANVGNVRANAAATATLAGVAAIDNTGATPSSVTTSATLSPTSVWVVETVELRSGRPTIPVVYFPYGGFCYNYSSGLNFTLPVTIRGEQGACLNYLGSAHAVDLGPTTLTTTTYQQLEYAVDNLHFTGGQNMTEGIFINPFLLTVRIRRNTFKNFGNAGASVYGIFSNGENDDLLVEENNIYDTDGVARKLLSTNHIATQLRYFKNNSACSTGFGSTCTSTQAGAQVTTAGASSVISENNFNFYCPNVLITDSGTGGAGYNTRVVNNYFEAANGCNAHIQVQNQDGVHIEQNFFNMNAISFPIAMTSGKLAVNMLVAHNYGITMPTTTEMVFQNNLAGQTGNLSFANMCAVAVGTAAAPCQKTHTAGASITQWNSDYAPPLTFAAGTTASYTFGSTFFVAPKCVIPPNIPGTATTLTITTLNTTTLAITASASNSATVNASCNPDAQ